MARVERITDLIGNTPLVRINKINEGGADFQAGKPVRIKFRASARAFSLRCMIQK